MALIREQLVVGLFQCNCNLLVCDRTKEAVIIDAGDDAEDILNLLKRHNVKLKYSIHTHAHLDHIGAVGVLKNHFPEMRIGVHKSDEAIYQALPMQGQMFGIQYEVPPKIDDYLQDGQQIQFGDYSLEVKHTPGHSPGGICLCATGGVLGNEPFLFTGDTLFRESIGRTDLWEGDYGLLTKSIKQRLYTLDDQTQVQPGHGPMTSIGYEKRNNPFVTG